ncbi:MAG: DegT/DnrJ/EryC1/StrS aminotransferase family protein [Clostridiales bacterium]|nr:DegT/DnrJ/EryC1/StrS aminotransferase family protein [Clostridiales bacterium]
MIFIDKHGEAAGAVLGALDGWDTVMRLERYAARLTGRNAVALSTADAAIDTALFLCGAGRGDYVFVPTFTFYSYIASVAHAGAIPVFLDCDPTTRCVSPDALDAAFVWAELQNKPPKAVIVDNAFGAVAELDILKPICTARNVPLIELALDGRGGEYNGKPLGASGDYGIIGHDKRLRGGGSVLLLNAEDRLAALGFSRYAYSEGENHDYRMNEFLSALWLNQAEVSDKLSVRAHKNLHALCKALDCVAPPTKGDSAVYAFVRAAGMMSELRNAGYDVKKPPPVHTLDRYKDCHYFEHERGYSVSDSLSDYCFIGTDMSAGKRNKLIRMLKS